MKPPRPRPLSGGRTSKQRQLISDLVDIMTCDEVDVKCFRYYVDVFDSS